MSQIRDQATGDRVRFNEGLAERICVLALGNDILGDDAVGLVAARQLRDLFPQIDVIEAKGSGLDLIDHLSSYDRLLILDSVCTSGSVPGTITELPREALGRVGVGSPHRAGLPEMLAVAEQLGIALPQELRILAMEVENPFDFREGLTDKATRGLPEFRNQAITLLLMWLNVESRIEPP